MRQLCLAILGTLVAVPAWAEEFYHDFRKGPLPDTFAPFQAKKEGLMKVEPEGLRITIPEDWKHPYGGVGVATTFGVQGDFEITTTYELLHADSPPKGYGVGLTLRIHKAEPSKELANMSRMVRKGDRHLVLWSRLLETPGEKPKYPEGEKPCADKIGRLRLKRTGATLHFLAAPGADGGEFDEIKQLEFGAEDIKRVSLVGITGMEPANVDVRFLDLRIESGSMNRVVPKTQAPVVDPERPQNYLWLIPVGVVAAGLLVLGLVVRRKRAPAQTAAVPTSSDQGTVASVEAHCPSCQKRLKVPATASGKKVKCPACATAFVV